MVTLEPRRKHAGQGLQETLTFGVRFRQGQILTGLNYGRVRFR